MKTSFVLIAIASLLSMQTCYIPKNENINAEKSQTEQQVNCCGEQGQLPTEPGDDDDD